jgi:glycosyltransferase involved in cell wall biosynthesis
MSAPRPDLSLQASDGRLTVLYVIWSLQMGGAERVVFELARSLDRRAFRPLVACLNFKGALAGPLEADGIPVVGLDKRPKFDPSVLVKLVRLMRRERVDVVHTHLWTSSFWGRLAAAAARVPVIVVTEHNLDTWRRAPHWLADRLLGRVTDDWIFVSDEVEAFYRARLPIPWDRAHVVHNGVDLAPFANRLHPGDVRARMGLPADARVAGVVGRLEARKGHHHFIEAMAIVAAREPRALGLIVGEGKEKPALLAQRDALGLGESVRLVGYWPQLAEAFAALDVFVLPSLMEGHPLAILEAMAAGKPVVATEVGGNREAVEAGITGLLVPAADPDALAEAILSLLRDTARAAAFGEAGRRSLERRFSLAEAVRANEDIYRRRHRENAERRTLGV